MAAFFYVYKTSGGERLTDEIEASSRDAAFAALRARGIRPIKVVAKDGTKANGEMHGVRKRIVAAVACAAALLAGGIAYWRGVNVVEDSFVVETEKGPVMYRVAAPLARQRIPGDRVRIVQCPTNLFAHAAEFLLARYAEPGRTVEAGGASAAFDEDDLNVCLKTPIRVASDEFTEYVDLKRIVVGMKRELAQYLADGGTAEQYAEELRKRQRFECDCRDKAERRLAALLETPEKAYAYWLKANAQLKAMGIYELPLPETLAAFQSAADFDE